MAVLRMTIALILLWASIGKFRSPRGFIRGLRSYSVLPSSVVPFVGYAVLAAEITAGVALLFEVAVVAAAGTALLMFSSFAVAISVVTLRGWRIPCSCFGTDDQESTGIFPIARSLVLAAAAAVVLLTGLKDLTSGFSLPGLIIASCACVGLRVASLYPQAWRYIRTPVLISPTHNHRINLRERLPPASSRV